MHLRIADGLDLPLDVATRRLAILAMSGAGKSNVAVVLAEAMYDAGIPWVAIDPKGDWYGVRSSADGKAAGLPIPIFGGLHGDLPLDANAGAYIANLIVDQRLTCVVDVSEFEDRQPMWKFLADFGQTLLRRNREALHLFLEECDDYIPQKAGEGGNLNRCKGVWQRVVKRGRFRGLGSSQISQRSATIDKDTLYQAEVLIALRAAGKGDRKAVEGWVEHHNAADEIVASLPTLADGEGWISSPAWLRTTRRLRFQRRRTFDSGATPVLAGGKKAAAPTLADLDLQKIRTQMAATIERVKADDPRELRRRIAELEREVAAAKKVVPPTPAPKPERVEVMVVGAKQITALERAADRLHQTGTTAIAAANEISQRLRLLRPGGGSIHHEQALAARANGDARVTPAPPPRPAAAPRPVRPGERRSGSQQRILDALAWLESLGLSPADKTQVALLADQSPTSGGYFNNLGQLRTIGYIDYPSPGQVALTDTGRAMASPGAGHVPATDEALHEQICRRLSKSQARILRELIASYPHALAKPSLAERTDQSPTSGGYFNNLGRLRSLGLIGYPTPGQAIALPVLFVEAR